MGERLKGGGGAPKEGSIWDGKKAEFFHLSDSGPGVSGA